MNRRYATVTLVILCLGRALAAQDFSPARVAQARVDHRAAEAAIMKADRDFNQAVADKNLDRFLSFVAGEATFSGGMPDQLRGRDRVAKAWAPYFQTDGPTLTWKPTKVEVLVGGDIGYTIGHWERRATDARSKGVTRGNYLTVWRRQADGTWRAVFDTGSQE